MLTAINLQRQTLRLYGEMVSRRESWGGRLVFAAGVGSSATGLPAAVSIAGGTTLAVDPDGAGVKAVFRQGGVDFVVTTLDEALRVLKNEIRQRRPLGVGLIAETGPVLAEMAERGVLPDLHVSISDPMEAPGREHLHLTAGEGGVMPSADLSAWLEGRGWTESVLHSTPEEAPRALDARLLAGLAAEETVRRNWLQRISHYQRATPSGSRVLWSAHE